MRDLRAELRDWHDDDPIRWQPDEGDILVGFLREPLPAEGDDLEGKQIIIEEERTGIGVTVELDSPMLAGLFDLHRPRARDRIGIKRIGCGADQSRRYIMVVDRDPAPDSAAEDDMTGATSEERDYIEQMMEQDADEPDIQEVSPTDKPAGVLSRNPAAKLTAVLLMLIIGGLLLLCPHWLTGLFH